MRDESSAPVDPASVDPAPAPAAGQTGGQAPRGPDPFDPSTVTAGADGAAIGRPVVQVAGSGRPYAGAAGPAPRSLAVGGARSLADRKFRASFDAGPFLIFLNGYFRPFIGASFALFLYAALNSGVISVSLPAASSYPFFYTALCFIAGFSEQLVPDLIQNAERNLSTQQIDASERRSG